MKKIEIVLPVVRLTVKDISALRMIADPKSAKCENDCMVDRLQALGLVFVKNLPPCPEKMREYRKLLRKADSLIRAAVRGRDINWTLINKAKSVRPNEYNAPKNRTQLTLTKDGQRLLSAGVARIEIQKAC